MAGALKSTSEGRTLILTISNPEHRNSMDPEIYAAGVEALNAAENNPEIRSVILTGEGTMFCAGADLQRLKANRQKPAEVQAQSIEALHSWVDSIRTFPKPVIAAVEGAAAGAGFSLALACDFIVAAENALFVMAHSTIGLSPDGGGSWALARALPRTVVARLLMLGERIPTAQLRWRWQLGACARPAAHRGRPLVDAGRTHTNGAALLTGSGLCSLTIWPIFESCIATGRAAQ